MLTVLPGVVDADGSGPEGGRSGASSLIDELIREGAPRMPAEALQAEVDDYIARHVEERYEQARRLVVRNGIHGQRARFSSAILPPWCRKTLKIT